jgi:hypothetical protein
VTHYLYGLLPGVRFSEKQQRSQIVVGRLREAAQYLTEQPLRSEPSLYFWGHHIPLRGGDFAVYPELLRVRGVLEKGIRRFLTEPDFITIMAASLVPAEDGKSRRFQVRTTIRPKAVAVKVR